MVGITHQGWSGHAAMDNQERMLGIFDALNGKEYDRLDAMVSRALRHHIAGCPPGVEAYKRAPNVYTARVESCPGRRHSAQAEVKEPTPHWGYSFASTRSTTQHPRTCTPSPRQ